MLTQSGAISLSDFPAQGEYSFFLKLVLRGKWDPRNLKTLVSNSAFQIPCAKHGKWRNLDKESLSFYSHYIPNAKLTLKSCPYPYRECLKLYSCPNGN